MNLKNTLENLKKSKNSFFNTTSGMVVWFDIYKENLEVYSEGAFIFKLKDTKEINKHFIDWNFKYGDNDFKESKMIPTIIFNFYIETPSYNIPFHRNSFKYLRKKDFLIRIK